MACDKIKPGGEKTNYIKPFTANFTVYMWDNGSVYLSLFVDAFHITLAIHFPHKLQK